MKNIDYINKLVANKKGLPESLVKKVNSFFWKTLSQNLYSHGETATFVNHLGTFTFSERRVRTEIIEVIHAIRRIRGAKRYSVETIQKIEATYMNYLKKLLVQHNELALRYIENKKNKQNYKILYREQMDRISETATESDS